MSSNSNGVATLREPFTNDPPRRSLGIMVVGGGASTHDDGSRVSFRLRRRTPWKGIPTPCAPARCDACGVRLRWRLSVRGC
jgi:hypothetical protein